MRMALFLDNRRFVALGALPRPSLGNPGIGGTEYEFLALAELLLAAAGGGRLDTVKRLLRLKKAGDGTDWVEILKAAVKSGELRTVAWLASQTADRSACAPACAWV
jgi:hypothetical protein